jgi:hypothetical protein
MRLLALTIIIVLFAAGSALGQAGTIIVSADEIGNDCNLQDKAAGMCSYYVVHVGAVGVQASSFSAPAPSCFSGTWLSDASEFSVTLGDTQNGVSMGYGECLNSPIHLLTINYFCQGITENCCTYKVYPHPDVLSGAIEVVDCNLNTLYGTGGRAVINPDSGCECGPPTQDSTWGKVKTMYGR